MEGDEMEFNKIISILLLSIILIVIISCDEKPTEVDYAIMKASVVDTLVSVSAPYGGPSPSFFWVYVTSEGTRPVNFEFDNSEVWINLENPFFTGVAPDSFAVRFRVQAPITLSEGVYYDTIRITSDADNPEIIIPVELTIGTNIEVDPVSVSFIGALNGVDPDPKKVAVRSTSGSAIPYTSSYDATWITVTQPSPNTSGTDSVTIEASLAGLTNGIYIDTVYFTSDSAFNDSIGLEVNLTISSWTNQTSPLAHDINGIYFKDTQNGWAVGKIANQSFSSGFLLKTVNGGDTWTTARLFSTTQEDADSTLGDIQFIGTTGYISGTDGILFKTIDDGDTWQPLTTPAGDSLSLNNICFISADTGWVVGQNGLVIFTTDGGSTWDVQTSNTTRTLQEVVFVDNMRGWAVGQANAIIATVDGGVTWTVQTAPVPSYSYDFQSVSFVDNANGWAVGKLGKVITTVNGGSTWTEMTMPEGQNLSGVYFADNLHGWIVGNTGLIYATTDGGATWETQYSGTDNWLYTIFFLDQNVGWVGGISGTILFTASGGFE